MIRPFALRRLLALLFAALLAVPMWQAVAAAVAGSAAAGAPIERRQLSEQERAAIRAVAASVAASPDRIDAVLAQLHFDQIARDLPGYVDWPTLRKVEAAYWSARAARGSPEGARLLGAIALIIERDHSAAIREEPNLQSYFAAPDTGTPISFARPTPTQLAELPPPEVRGAILAIERYADRVPGGLQGVMNSCCFSDLDRVYETLHSAPTRLEALIVAIQNGNLPQEVKERLLRAIRLVMEGSTAVMDEPALMRVLNQLDPNWNEVLVASPESTTTTTGSDVAEQNKMRDIYEAARAAHPATRADMPPFVILGLGPDVAPPTASGPGPGPQPGPRPSSNNRRAQSHDQDKGPLTASQLDDGATAPPGMPPGGSSGGGGEEAANRRRFLEMQVSVQPEAGSIGPHPSPMSEGPGGMPRFTFSMMRSSGAGPGGVLFGNRIDAPDVAKPVRAIWVPDVVTGGAPPQWGHFDVVLRTHKVIMTGRMRAEDAFAAWEIVNGRDGVFAPLDIADGEGVGLASVSRSSALMLVHPALFRLQLGNAAARADAVGFAMSPGAFCRRLEMAQVPLAVIVRALRWRTAENGWYKILDAPLRLVAEGGALRVVHMPDPDVSPALAQEAFLDFQAIVDGKPVARSDFTPSVPALIAAFPEIARLNAFAETFAIVRWARLSEAMITPPPKPAAVTPLLAINAGPDGNLTASADEDTPDRTPFEQIADIKATGAGITCLLRAAGAPESALASMRTLIDARVQVARIQTLQSRLDDADMTLPQRKAALSLLDAMDQQGRAPSADLKRFSSEERIVAAFTPGPDADTLILLGTTLRNAEADVDRQRQVVDRLTDREARVETLPPERAAQVEARLADLEDALSAYENADAGKPEETALAALQRAKADYLSSLPPVDETALSGAKASLAKVLSAEKDIQQNYSSRLQGLTPAWLLGASQYIEDFAQVDDTGEFRD